ncbi:MAG: phospholipase/carboxylesterase [Mariniblastus sp.]|jgi:phospholipase/carboxylesterase
MNRIKISPLATSGENQLDHDSASKLSLDNLDKLTNRTDDFSLFVPMHYEKNYAYPLVVWLHSDGKDSGEVHKVMPQASMRNFVGVAPQSPIGNFEAGYYWEQEPDTIDMAHDSILAAIEGASSRYNIAPQRIFIGGAGTGGTMAFRIALERPELFSGVISINGPIPDGQKPLGQWAECRELPVFWAHSRRNQDFGQETLCQQLRLLHIAGFSVTLRQYPSECCLNEKTLSDMNKWIMEAIGSTIA